MAENEVRIKDLTPNTGTDTGGGVIGSLDVIRTGSTSAVATLTAVTTGNGTTVDWGAARVNMSLMIIVNGTVTGGVIDLQVSQDGTAWVKVASSSALATGVNQKIDFNAGAFRYARGVVSTNVAGGGTATATLMSA